MSTSSSNRKPPYWEPDRVTEVTTHHSTAHLALCVQPPAEKPGGEAVSGRGTITRRRALTLEGISALCDITKCCMFSHTLSVTDGPSWWAPDRDTDYC